MQCTECGYPVEPEARFCDQCRCPVGVTGATIRLTPDLAFGSGVGAANYALTQVRSGMAGYYADGVRLGKVRDIWYGSDPTTSTEPCDEDLCSRLEVTHGWLRPEVLYIPYTALAGVSDGVVLLNVAAETSHPSTWHQKPRWIPIRNGVSDVTEKQPLGGV